MICPLCNKNSDIVESHIIPSFVYQWFKETSGTGYMRFGKNPNLRIQDGVKYPLLCKSCEIMISNWEKLFSEKIFKISCDNELHYIRYGVWLAKFAASLSWRVLIHFKKENIVKELSDITQKQAQEALSNWRSFILGEVKNPGCFELHFIRLGLINSYSYSEEMSPNINRYLTRTIDIDIPEGKTLSFVYIKLCHCLILGILRKPDKEVFKNTLIHINNGYIGNPKTTLPSPMLHYFNERANKTHRIFQSMSKIQKEKISHTIRKDMDRMIESELFKALNQDVMMFGDDAFSPEDIEKEK